MELVVTEAEGGPLRLALQGRLDAAGADKVEAGFAAVVSGAGRDVVVDLSGVSFVGSLGIRLLISAARTATRRGWRLVVFGVQPQVNEVFGTVSLDDIIPILPDGPAALAHLAA